MQQPTTFSSTPPYAPSSASAMPAMRVSLLDDCIEVSAILTDQVQVDKLLRWLKANKEMLPETDLA